MIFIVKGTCTLGCMTRDKDGNIIRQTPAEFKTGQGGGSVAVGILDDETEEQIGQANIYGDWDHWGILREALKLLGPTRPGNMPDFEDIFREMRKEQNTTDCPFRPHCNRVSCANCICMDWMEDGEE